MAVDTMRMRLHLRLIRVLTVLVDTTSRLDVIERCECPDGCPSCVQSPKYANGNEPLDKARATRFLHAVLGE